MAPPAKKSKTAAIDPFLGCKLDKTQRVYWGNITQPRRDILATKFFHVPTLETLGLTRYVRPFLDKGGMSGFITRNAPTYRRLTLEFLATLVVQKESQSCKFRLFNNDYELSYDTLRTVFGLDPRERVQYPDEDLNKINDLWFGLTRHPWPTGGEKNSSISHPGFRLIHRILSMGMFCQGEPTNVSAWELHYLLALTPDGVGIPNWVHIFLKGCIVCRTEEKGKLAMGGMVTLIARHLRLNLDSEKPLSGSYVFDVKALKSAKMLIEETDPPAYIWMFGPTPDRYLRLPRPEGFPIGPTNADLFVAPDPNLGREPADAPVGVAWDQWRLSVDEKLLAQSDELSEVRAEVRGVRDVVDELMIYARSFSDMCLSSPLPYTRPDDSELRERERQRVIARQLREDARAARARGGAGPSGSS